MLLASHPLNPTSPSIPRAKGKELRYTVKQLEELLRRLKDDIEALEKTDGLDLDHGFDITAELRRYENSLIQTALRVTGGNQRKAAELLGIPHTTLNSKVKRHNIQLELFTARRS